MGTYFANAYFSRQKPKIATVFSVISSSVNIVLNCILGFFFGIFGLAAASSIAFLTGNILQISNIHRVNPEYRLTIALSRMANPFMAGMFTFAVTYFLKIYINKIIPENIFGLIAFISIGFMLYSTLFLFFCLIFRVGFIVEIKEKLRMRFNKNS